MRLTSGWVATAAMLLVGLAVLAVAGRLLPSAPSTQPPATTDAAGATTAPAVRTAPGNTRGYVVPDALGRTLPQAERVMHTAGLHGVAHERDPQGRNAVVVAQEPPAGVLVPPGSVVGFRTGTRVQPSGVPRRLRLGRGPTSAAYRIVAPDPATHQLTVTVVVPRATDIQVWLETGARLTVWVLGGVRDAEWCPLRHGKVRCVVQLGVPAEGVWTARVAKRSSLPAAIELTVTFTPV